MSEQNLGAIEPPCLLDVEYDTRSFSSGEVELDQWLKQRALKAQESGAARTYVVVNAAVVVGYYALAAGSVVRAGAVGKMRRNMPDPVPVLILARLAVCSNAQGIGLGGDLLRDALVRTLQAADIVGVRGLLVHALSDSARSFYERFGFRVSPIDSMTLMISLEEARRELA